MNGSNMLISTHCCIIWLLIGQLVGKVSSDASPRVYDFSNKDSTDIQRYGDRNAIDYFRLLEVDGDHLIIGAADAVHNISIDKFERISLYEWKPGTDESAECLMKTKDDQSSCRNYVRVLSRDERNGYLLICGTNSYKPQCRIVDTNNKTVVQFDGTGMSPFNPKHNTTFYRDNDFLYSATVADFGGDDHLIFRKNISDINDHGIRTEKNNKFQLKAPQFVGTLNSEKFVYFFFREQAADASEASTYSRVARVCKNDIGTRRNNFPEWSSFVKMRLNCSIPEKNKRFYFDEIISISNVTHNINASQVVYATFVSEYDFLRYSVICAFDLNQIDNLFATSDYVGLEQNTGKWIKRKQNERDRITKLRQCQKDDLKPLDYEDQNIVSKYPLLADSAPNIFGRAVGIHRGSDNYNQIVVLEAVQIQEGQVDVLYVGTDQGNVIKMVNLVDKNNSWNSTTDIDSDPMHQVAIFKVSNLPIRRLLIAKNKYLIVVTDSVVYRLPLHFCSSHSTCDQCVEARDPHCVWHQGECTSVKNVKQRFVYQDMLQKRSKICDEARAVEKPKIEKKPTTIKPEAKFHDEKKNSTFDVLAAECNCNARDVSQHSKCNCSNHVGGVSENKKSINTSNFNQAPIVSNEVEQSKGKNWSFWIFLGIIVVLIQTGALIILYCKYQSKRRKAKKANVTLQMPKTSVQSVINAYCPTLTDAYGEKQTLDKNGTLQLKNGGTLRRGPMGEVNIQLNGSNTPSINY